MSILTFLNKQTTNFDIPSLYILLPALVVPILIFILVLSFIYQKELKLPVTSDISIPDLKNSQIATESSNLPEREFPTLNSIKSADLISPQNLEVDSQPILRDINQPINYSDLEKNISAANNAPEEESQQSSITFSLPISKANESMVCIDEETLQNESEEKEGFQKEQVDAISDKQNDVFDNQTSCTSFADQNCESLGDIADRNSEGKIQRNNSVLLDNTVLDNYSVEGESVISTNMPMKNNLIGKLIAIDDVDLNPWR